MNSEFSLMELNVLYVAISNELNNVKVIAKQHPSEFWDNQLKVTEELHTKIQERLYSRATAIDEQVSEWVDESEDIYPLDECEIHELIDTYSDIALESFENGDYTKAKMFKGIAEDLKQDWYDKNFGKDI